VCDENGKKRTFALGTNFFGGITLKDRKIDVKGDEKRVGLLQSAMNRTIKKNTVAFGPHADEHFYDKEYAYYEEIDSSHKRWTAQKLKEHHG